MNTPKDYVLALVAETKNDISARQYVSEGIYATVQAIGNGLPKVISTDILGPTWFPSIPSKLNTNQKYKIYHSTATPAKVQAAVLSGDLLSLHEMRKKIIDPSWRLSNFAAEEMCDFTLVKQTPVLNLLNAFEYAMDNIFKAAANLASSAATEKDTVWLIDAKILAKKKHRGATVADVVIGRTRRIVSLFLGYTLTDILKWKRAVSRRLVESELPPLDAIPPLLPYEELIALLKERIKKFDEGLLADNTTVYNYNNSDKKEEVVVPSVSTIMTNVISSVREGVYPKIFGTFYEAILGYDIVSLLAPIISAEYIALLMRMRRAPTPPNTTQLDKFVNSKETKILPSETVSENDKVWIENERSRIKTPAELAFRNHQFLSKGIVGILGPNRSEVALRALERETDINTPEELEQYIIRSRQVSFSNFSLMRIGGEDAPRLAMYALWNTLFFSTGGFTYDCSSNGVRSRLLAQVFLKDLYALFSCQRCEMGFFVKTLDTFSILEMEKMNNGEGEKQMVTKLQMCVLALDPDAVPERKVGHLIVQILTTPSNFTFAGEENYCDLVLYGKIRQQQQDEAVKNLYNLDKIQYAFEAAMYISVSEGFALLAFYLLYASVATSNTVEFNLNAMDRTVYLLLSRWGNVRFPTANLWGRENNDKSTSPLLAFAAIWALRNAVRARRQVNDASNTNFTPGRPLPFICALSSTANSTKLLENNYCNAEKINSEELVWKALEEMQLESEIWAANGKRVSAIEVKNQTVARLVVEPSGLIPLFDTVKKEQMTADVDDDDVR